MMSRAGVPESVQEYTLEFRGLAFPEKHHFGFGLSVVLQLTKSAQPVARNRTELL